MWNQSNDDDSDFTSTLTGNSKLSSLFGSSKAESGNSSLKYTAPKQPKAASNESNQSSQPIVLWANAVGAFKILNNEYQSQGKLGVAVLATIARKEFRIILYVSKEKQVTYCLIQKNTQLSASRGQYVTFLDSQNTYWSLLFDSELLAMEFVRQVSILKYLMGDSASMVTQDLVDGEGDVVGNDDNVEVRYSGWLMTDAKCGTLFDSNTAENVNPFRFKVGAHKVISGWEQGVIGMKKLGKRILVIPPVLAYGDKGHGNAVPPNSCLIFFINVLRVKIASRSRTQTNSSEKGETVKPPLPLPNIPMEGDRERTRALSTAESEKAKLLSRMAKMGQAIIPSKPQEASDSESNIDDSAPEDHPVPVPEPKPHVIRQPRPTRPQQPMAAPTYPQVYPYPQGQQFEQPADMAYMMSHTQSYPAISAILPYQSVRPPVYQMAPGPEQYPPNPPAAASTTAQSDMHSAMLVNETRQQNTEMRLAVSKLQDRVDKVLDKLNSAEVDSKSQMQVSVPNLEVSVVFQNLSRIIQENERLKKDLIEKSERIEQQNDKINDLLKRNQSYVEQNHLFIEQKSDTYKASATEYATKVLNLEHEKLELSKSLSQRTSEVSDLQLRLTTLEQSERQAKSELSQALHRHENHDNLVVQLKSRLATAEDKTESAEKALRDERKMRVGHEDRVRDLEEELLEIKAKLQKSVGVASERKAKLESEREKFESDLSSVRQHYETESQSLRDQLWQERNSSDRQISKQASDLEKEISRVWKEKSESMVTLEKERCERIVSDLQAEKLRLEEQLQLAQQKVTQTKMSATESSSSMEELQYQLDEAQHKYKTVVASATKMKARLEEKLQELVEERDELQEKLETKQAGSSASDVAGELKRVMNSVFQQVRQKIAKDGNYSGQQVLQIIVKIIQRETLRATGDLQESDEEEEEVEEEVTEDRRRSDGHSSRAGKDPLSPPPTPGETNETSELMQGAVQKLHHQQINERLQELSQTSPTNGKLKVAVQESNVSSSDPISPPPTPGDLVSQTSQLVQGAVQKLNHQQVNKRLRELSGDHDPSLDSPKGRYASYLSSRGPDSPPPSPGDIESADGHVINVMEPSCSEGEASPNVASRDRSGGDLESPNVPPPPSKTLSETEEEEAGPGTPDHSLTSDTESFAIVNHEHEPVPEIHVVQSMTPPALSPPADTEDADEEEDFVVQENEDSGETEVDEQEEVHIEQEVVVDPLMDAGDTVETEERSSTGNQEEVHIEQEVVVYPLVDAGEKSEEISTGKQDESHHKQEVIDPLLEAGDTGHTAEGSSTSKQKSIFSDDESEDEDTKFGKSLFSKKDDQQDVVKAAPKEKPLFSDDDDDDLDWLDK